MLDAFRRIMTAVAAALEQFVEAGGVALVVRLLSAKADTEESRAREAEDGDIRRAIASGDVGAVERITARLLREARDSLSRGGRGATSNRDQSRGRDSHSEYVPVVRNAPTVEDLQREVDEVLSEVGRRG